MNILIVDTLGIQVVSAIRSLSKAGHVVSIAIPDESWKNKMFFFSKKLSQVFFISSPIDINSFKKNLEKLLEGQKYDVVLPFGFETTVAISSIKKDILKYTKTSVADFDLIQKVHDKEYLNNMLYENHFTVPTIYQYNSLEELLAQNIRFPVVVKARKGCGIEKGVRYATNKDELEKFYLEISSQKSNNTALSDYSYPLIQEYIPGKIYDGCFVCYKGEVVASLAQVRDVTYPITGGVGANIVTLEDNELLEYCTKILKFLKWHGPCQVEVKKDSRDNKYKLIEINPKLWGTLGASIHAGIDFSLKACEVAKGIKNPQTEYKKNLKYKILFPLEVYTIYQDKGNRLKRFLKLFEVFQKNVKTEIDIFDIKPNILAFLGTMYVLMFRRDSILPKGQEFYEKS